MAAAASAAGVQIVTGDTKVVQRGKADGCYINTAGVGRRRAGVDARRAATAQPGDVVIVSGPIGDHGITIMLARGELDIEADVDLRHRAAERRWSPRCWRRAAGRARAARRDPRRRGHHPQRDRRSGRRRSRGRRGRDSGAAPRCAARPNCSASTRCTSPARAGWSRSSIGDAGRRGAGRAARAPARREQAAVIGRGHARTRPAWCCCGPRSAAPGSSTCWSATRCPGSADTPACRRTAY